jgi:hypothetical protein
VYAVVKVISEKVEEFTPDNPTAPQEAPCSAWQWAKKTQKICVGPAKISRPPPLPELEQFRNWQSVMLG